MVTITFTFKVLLCPAIISANSSKCRPANEVVNFCDDSVGISIVDLLFDAAVDARKYVIDK